MRTGGGGYCNNSTLAAACMQKVATVLIRIEAAPGFAGFAAAVRGDPRDGLQLGRLEAGLRGARLARCVQSGAGGFLIAATFNSFTFFCTSSSMEQNCSSIHEAILDGDLDCAEKLLEMGADPNAKDELGRTPLHLAAQFGYLGLVKLLLDSGADPNVRNDRDGKTALHYAVVRDNFMVVLLLEAGADPDIADDSGETPLHTAAYVGNYEAVKLFLNYRVSLELKDEYFGRTALHWAAKGCHANVVWLLLLRGADPNARDGKGRTPLHLAVQTKPCVDVAKILLEAGADPNAQDVYGKTPLHYAVMHDNPRIVSLFLKYGADPTIRDASGLTPLDLAKSRGKAKAAKVIAKAASTGRGLMQYIRTNTE